MNTRYATAAVTVLSLAVTPSSAASHHSIPEPAHSEPTHSSAQALSDALKFSREDVDLRVEEGRRQTRTVRLENASDQDITLHQLVATDPSITLAIGNQNNLRLLDETPLDRLLKPGDKIRIHITADVSSLEIGPHSFAIEAQAGDDSSSLPLHVEVYPEEQEDDDNAPGRKIKPIVSDGPPPKLMIDRYVHDFGDCLTGETLKTKFTLRNEGEGDLILQHIRVQCSCSIAALVFPGGQVSGRQLQEDVIGVLKPNEEATLEVAIHTSRLGGEVRKEFHIYTNNPGQPDTVVAIGGRISNPFSMSPPSLVLDRVRRSERTETKIRISSNALQGFELVGFEQRSPPIFDVSFRRLPKKNDVQEVTLKLRDDAPFGPREGNVKLAIDHPRVQELRVYYSINVVSDVDFIVDGRGLGTRLDFGLVRKLEDSVRKFRIVNHNPEVPYRPTELKLSSRTSPDAIHAELVTIQEGIEYEVLVKLVKAPPLAFFDGAIEVLAPDYSALQTMKLTMRGNYSGPR